MIEDRLNKSPKFQIDQSVMVSRKSDEQPFKATITSEPWQDKDLNWMYKVRTSLGAGIVVNESELSSASGS